MTEEMSYYDCNKPTTQLWQQAPDINTPIIKIRCKEDLAGKVAGDIITVSVLPWPGATRIRVRVEIYHITRTRDFAMAIPTMEQPKGGTQ